MGTEAKDTLMQMALGMDAADRLALAARLLESVRDKADTAAVVDCALTACGLQELDAVSQRQENVAARCIIAYTLSGQGMPMRQIAAVIRKDRTTAIYCRKRMQDALTYPGAYPGMVNKYAKFKQLLHG